MKINSFPKNKKKYVQLIRFCKAFLPNLEKKNIKPILYGSLACFAYTKNKELEVNDIDFYVPENSLIKIKKILKKLKIHYRHSKKWHTLVIEHKNLKIDFDSIEFWTKNIKKKYNDFQFINLKLKVIGINALIDIYEKAFRESQDKKSLYLIKLNLLKNLK